MSETLIPTELREYMDKYNLDPANHIASAKNQMRLEGMIMEIAKNTYAERHIDKPEEFHTMTLLDKWNK